MAEQIDLEKRIAVRNRNRGYTNYHIPDLNITRSFTAGETKYIDLGELEALQFTEGGDDILRNCLMINDKDALSYLNMSDVEPEYFYTEAEIKELLDNGSLDQLEDALNFAPDGVIDLIKQYAISSQLPDTRKRKLISDKTGFNIDNAIRVNNIMAEDETSTTEETPRVTRKAAPVVAQSKPAERKATPAAPSKYKVVSH